VLHRLIILGSCLVVVGGCTAERAYTATISRDAWGAPHVQSTTDEGVVFGAAWALAEDDWPLIEGNYLNAIGRAAEKLGEDAIPDDWMARTLEIPSRSTLEYHRAPSRIRELLEAHAAGMNGWLEANPDSTRILQRVEPWHPLALIRFKYYQNEFLGYAELEGEWAERLRTTGLPTAAGMRSVAEWGGHTTIATAPLRYKEDQFDPMGLRPRGSNQWALAGSRTASGAPMLLINPHQRFVGVQRYAEIHLDSDEGLQFSGLTVFGFLLPYMGNSPRHGWAYTDNYADHSDLYALQFDDAANPLSYRYDGGQRAAIESIDTLRVREGDSLRAIPMRLWKSHHGPIVGVDSAGRPLAVKMSGFEEGGWFEQWDAMIRAQSLEEWQRAVAMLRVAYMNAMYADRDGNIGYIYGSAIPRRNAGVSPAGVLDGSNIATEWQGIHPFSELPQVWNPRSGWLLNTNSTPFVATDSLPFTRDNFPGYMVGDEINNARAIASRRALLQLEQATLEQFAAAATSSRLAMADSLIPIIAMEWRANARHSADGDKMVAGLEAWNREADTSSVPTTWMVLTFEERGIAARRGDSSATPWVDAIVRVAERLRARWGSIDVPWGQLSRHQRPLPGATVALDSTRPSLAVGAAPGSLGSIFTFNTAPNATMDPRLGTSGNSFVKVVEFTAVPRAMSILNYGQRGDPASPHWFDQAVLYAARQFKPAWWSREEVAANAVRSYAVSGRVGR
jgi:acyl-homoserine-lactone acylase